MGAPRPRGEAAFAAALLALAFAALAAALAIPGEGLAAPGALPVAAAAVMVGAGGMNLAQAWRRAAPSADEGFARPRRMAATLALTVALAAALAPAGFIVAGVVFVSLTAMVLGAGFRAAVLTALGVVAAVWIVFRLVFEVLLPTGPIPEAAWLSWIDDLLTAGR